MAALTDRELNRATLHRQSLLARRPSGVVAATRGVCGLQAQEPVSPYVALWNRVTDFEASALNSAIEAERIVKATLMRITLHLVAADDLSWMRAAMRYTLRASRLNARRFRQAGINPAAVEALIPAVLRYLAEPRRNADVEAFLASELGEEGARPAWWALRSFAPLIRVPTDGRWQFGDVRFKAWSEDPVDEVAARQRLIRSYLEAFGPASPQDLGQFALLRQAEIRPALEPMVDDLVELETADGRRLYDVPGGFVPSAEVDAPPRLLGMWDNTMLAYKDRTRILPEPYRSIVIRRNGDVLPTVLVDGYVAGVWRVLDGSVEITAFETLSRGTWRALEEEAADLLDMVGERDPAPYRRAWRWFEEVPAAETRLLGR